MRILNRPHQLIAHKAQNWLPVLNRLGKLPQKICSCLRSGHCQVTCSRQLPFHPLLCLTPHSQQKGQKIPSTTMPKWEARLLLGPKFNPAGEELVSDFFWLKRFEKKKRVLNFISPQESERLEKAQAYLGIFLLLVIANIFKQKYMWAEKKKKRCKIIIDARLTVGQNWWNCWRILSLCRDPVMLPRSAGARVICCLRPFYLVFHSGIIVLHLFTWILFHPFLHTVFPFQLAVPEGHTRTPSWLCTKKYRQP